MKVLCIGKSVMETTCLINERVEEGKIIHVENRSECGGGTAGNIAYLLGKWGVESYIASMVGADDFASRLKKEYETIGIKTDYMETSYDKKTGQIISIVNETNKDNTIIDIKSGAYLKKYAFGIEPDIIVSDCNDFNASVAAFDKYPKIPSYLIVSNNSNETIELCKYATNLIFNRETAEIYTNMKFDYNNANTLVSIYNAIKQKFSKSEIIITLGERGSLYAINGQVKIMPPVKVGIVDTNGAKDTFAGALIYGMGKNFGYERSIAYATIAASLSTTKVTSRNSIPTLMEVSNYFDSKFGAQNNPNHQVATPNNNEALEKPNENMPNVPPTNNGGDGGQNNINNGAEVKPNVNQ